MRHGVPAGDRHGAQRRSTPARAARSTSCPAPIRLPTTGVLDRRGEAGDSPSGQGSRQPRAGVDDYAVPQSSVTVWSPRIHATSPERVALRMIPRLAERSPFTSFGRTAVLVLRLLGMVLAAAVAGGPCAGRSRRRAGGRAGLRAGAPRSIAPPRLRPAASSGPRRDRGEARVRRACPTMMSAAGSMTGLGHTGISGRRHGPRAGAPSSLGCPRSPTAVSSAPVAGAALGASKAAGAPPTCERYGTHPHRGRRMLQRLTGTRRRRGPGDGVAGGPTPSLPPALPAGVVNSRMAAVVRRCIICRYAASWRRTNAVDRDGVRDTAPQDAAPPGWTVMGRRAPAPDLRALPAGSRCGAR